jgi:hypothetical protein
VTTLTASISGWLVAGTYTGANVTANKARPTTTAPIGTISPFWDTLTAKAVTGAGVYVQRFAAGDDPEVPAAHWVVQYARMASTLSLNDDINFEVKFFDSGAVEYHYGSMESGTSSVYGGGASASAWLELPDAGAAIGVGINTTYLRPTNTLAYRFSPTAP